MAVYTPTTVTTERELIVALKTKQKCICIINEEFFWETQEKAEKLKKIKKRKGIAEVGIALGGLGAAALSGGISVIMLLLFGGSSVFTALAHKKDSFRGYDLFIDYDGHRIILIRNTLNDSFNKNKDKITGIDIDYLDNLSILEQK